MTRIKRSSPYVGYHTRIDWPTPELAVLISVLAPGKALDIGCGHGTESIFLGYYGWKVVGFDREKDKNEYPIEAAKRRIRSFPQQVRENVNFLASDLQDFELQEPGTFDLVIDRLVYHNFNASGRRKDEFLRRKLLSLAASALRPDGLFLMRFAYDASPWEFLGDDPLFPISEENRGFIKRRFWVGRHVGFPALTSPHGRRRKKKIAVQHMSLLVLKRKPTKSGP